MTLQINESFVPLTTATANADKREFQVTVIPQKENSQTTFHTLEKGSLPSVDAGILGAKKHCEPQLSMQRDGDRITNIRIQCSCGQVMELACVYDPAAKTK
jgi:hypothetical protein